MIPTAAVKCNGGAVRLAPRVKGAFLLKVSPEQKRFLLKALANVAPSSLSIVTEAPVDSMDHCFCGHSLPCRIIAVLRAVGGPIAKKDLIEQAYGQSEIKGGTFREALRRARLMGFVVNHYRSDDTYEFGGRI